MNDDRAKLIYDESVRKMTEQQTVLDGLRTRTGILLTGASIATSFLGGQALDGGFTGWSVVALLALAVVGFATIWKVLGPRGPWYFSHDIKALLRVYVDAEKPPSMDDVYIGVARTNQMNWERNEEKFLSMLTWFQVASVALLVEVVLWFIDLAS